MRMFGGDSSPRAKPERPGRKGENHAETAASESAADHPLLAELTALLDGVPGSRKLLRHLAGVEHGLKKKDPTGVFLFRVDAAVLRTALRQLDGLMPASPPRGLSALRGRMTSAIAAQEKREKEREMLSPRSDLLQSHKLEVGEVSASAFDRLSEQWQGRRDGS
ncbi:MAG: hypothetical protein U1E89_12575 [Burkholderiaceae bacterium]